MGSTSAAMGLFTTQAFVGDVFRVLLAVKLLHALFYCISIQVQCGGRKKVINLFSFIHRALLLLGALEDHFVGSKPGDFLGTEETRQHLVGVLSE